MDRDTCVIWGTDLVDHGRGSIPDTVSNISLRAGGNYQYVWRLQHTISNLSSEEKAKLTTWLVNQRLDGNKWPLIDLSVIEDIEKYAFLTISTRIDRFLLFCFNKRIRPGRPIYKFIRKPNLRGNIGLDSDEIYAWTETLDWEDFMGLRGLMIEYGLIVSHSDLPNELPEYDSVSASGYARIEVLTGSNTNSKQAFVAMWFDPHDKTVFDLAIKPAIEIGPDGKETGFKAVRVDREHHTDFIMDFMIGNIKRSRFMVADFSSYSVKDKEGHDHQIPRGGVYFEAGYALGLNIPVIATCRDDQKDAIHFDLKQFNTIYWKDVDELKKLLSERIFRMFVT